MAIIGTNQDGSAITSGGIGQGQNDNQSRGPIYIPPNKKLKRASFMGYPYPVTEVTVQGSIRDHIHEYPHANGGAPEKMGRRVYIIKMHALFFTNGKEYPHLWPTTLNYLRTYFERQTTGPLVIPTIGTIQAYCRNWTTVQTSKVLSGETAELEFVEDQGSAELVQALITATPTFVETFGRYNAALLLAEFSKPADISIFDAVANAVNGVLAVNDTLNAAGNLISSKLLTLSDYCASAEKTSTAQNPMNYPLIQSLKQIWDTALTASQTFYKEQASLAIYVVPTKMSVSSISSAVYQGDSSHGVDIMQLNAIPDPFAVRAGTPIRYVQDASFVNQRSQF